MGEMARSEGGPGADPCLRHSANGLALARPVELPVLPAKATRSSQMLPAAAPGNGGGPGGEDGSKEAEDLGPKGATTSSDRGWGADGIDAGGGHAGIGKPGERAGLARASADATASTQIAEACNNEAPDPSVPDTSRGRITVVFETPRVGGVKGSDGSRGGEGEGAGEHVGGDSRGDRTADPSCEPEMPGALGTEWASGPERRRGEPAMPEAAEPPSVALPCRGEGAGAGAIKQTSASQPRR